MERIIFSPVAPANITIEDKLKIASSAYIPLYHFPEMNYRNIEDIIIYENNFDMDFDVSESKHIEGMVGDGPLNHIMILSLKAIRESFEPYAEARNTPLHEFAHLIDKADGEADGNPTYLMPKNLIKPWINRVHNEIKKIKCGESQINPYAATNEEEFFAVATEYLFEKPEFLKTKHPELYAMLLSIYGIDIKA